MKIGFSLLHDYQTFESLNDMNEHVAIHLENNYLNQNTVKVLEYISKLASHHNGACRALYATIASKLDVSVATVNRCVKSLKESKIIAVFSQRRRTLRGGSSSNVITILPFDSSHDISRDSSPITKKTEDNFTESKDEDECNSPSNLLTNSKSTDLSNVNTDSELNNLMIEFISKGINKAMYMKALEETKARKPAKLVNYMRRVLENISKNIANKTKNFRTENQTKILMYDFTTGEQVFR